MTNRGIHFIFWSFMIFRTGLKTLDLSSFDTSSLTGTNNMFKDADGRREQAAKEA